MFILLLFLSIVSTLKADHEIEQLKEVTTRFSTCESLKTVLQKLETNKREFESFKTESKKEIADLKTTLNNCNCQSDEPKEKRLLMQERAISPQAPDVAFSACLDHDVSLGELQTIEYNRVLTNLGGAYDARHGHFTAPVRGIYKISATAVNYRNYETHIEIVKNGVQLAELYGDPITYSQSSQTLVLELQANDMVWVRHFRTTTSITIYGRNDQPLNTFSGVLLVQIN